MKQQPRQPKPKNNYMTPVIIIACITLPLVIWYQVTNSVMEKLLILFTFFTVVAPLSLGIVNICINMMIKPKKMINNKPNVTIGKMQVKPNTENTQNIFNNIKGVTNNNNYTNSYTNTKKGGKVNPSEYYPIVRNALIVYFKEGILTREDILLFKDHLNSRLGNRLSIYNNFQFKNDANEIYTKLKSSILKDDDYKYLIDVLNQIIQQNNNQQGII